MKGGEAEMLVKEGGRINGSDRRVDEGDLGRYEEMMDVWEY